MPAANVSVHDCFRTGVWCQISAPCRKEEHLQSLQDVHVPAQRRHVLQVSDPHEGFVEVVQLQNTGQQEKARNQNTGEEL